MTIGQAPGSRPAGGSSRIAVRRLGTSPSGATPASRATWSAQAPAASTSTAAAETCRQSSRPPSRRCHARLRAPPLRDQPAAPAAQPAQIALVEQRDVDRARGRLEQATHGVARLEQRHQRPHRGGVEPARIGQQRLAAATACSSAARWSARAMCSMPRGLSSGAAAKSGGGCSRKGRLMAASRRTSGLP